MKCAMIGIGAAVLAATTFADVESANVVGYSTKTIKNAIWHAVPVQFQAVGGASTIKVDEFINCTNLIPGEYGDGSDGTMNGAPVIQVPQENAAGGYDCYYYISDAWDDAKSDFVEGNCWADLFGLVLTDESVVTTGKGFWFCAKCDDATASGAGQVLDGDTATLTPKAEVWVMIANPFPTPVALQSVITTGLIPGEYGDGSDGTMGGAPVIQVPQENVAGGYDCYYYISDAWDDAANDFFVGNCWADLFGLTLSETQIPVGKSAWYKASTAGSITFNK